MKKFYIILLFSTTCFFCCKKDSFTSSQINIEKIDSIRSSALPIMPSDCNPLPNQGLIQFALLKFEYDSLGRIKIMKRFVESANTNPYAIYSFYYNNKDQIEKITSKTTDIGTSSYDSIIIENISENELKVKHYILNKLSQNLGYINIFTFLDNNNIIKIDVSTGLTITSTKNYLNAELFKNLGNIERTRYSRNYYNKIDTINNISYQYSSHMNPYYSLYYRLGFPLFYVISKGGLSSGLNFVDLAQEYSLKTISSFSNQIIHPACAGQNSFYPAIENFNLSFNNLFTLDNNSRIIGIQNPDSTLNQSSTISGIINSHSAFFYK
jgi:hypothetical protein